MRGRFMAVALAVSVSGLAGCYLPPPGEPPVRYSNDLPGKSVSVTSNVVFSTAQDGTAKDLTLDVYRPTPDTLTKRPLVVFVHGGAFRVGSKTSTDVVVLSRAFAQKGYVTASINYRLLGPPTGNCGHAGVDTATCLTASLAAQHDAQAAVRYLRDHAATYGIDPDRIAISGTSAGAATALLVAVNDEDTGDSGTPGVSSAVQAAFPISGAVPPAFRSLFRANLDPTDAPVYFFYGNTDQVVPPAWVKSNAADLNELAAGADLYELNGGHVPFTPTDQGIYESQGPWFLYSKLDLVHAQS